MAEGNGSDYQSVTLDSGCVSILRLTDDRGRFDDAMGVLGAIQK